MCIHMCNAASRVAAPSDATGVHDSVSDMSHGLTESDDPPPPPKPPRQKAKLTAGDRDKIAELAVQKMKSSEISESGSVSI